MKRALLLGASLLLLAWPAAASVITSTSSGGNWAVGSTWVGGLVPGAGDEVVIAGPVVVPSVQSCLSLSVEPAGSLRGLPGAPNRLEVGGPVDNAGTVIDDPFYFDLQLAGDLHNSGSLLCRSTIFAGAGDYQLSMEPGSRVMTSLDVADGATCALTLDTPFTLTGNVDVRGGQLTLAPDCPLTVTDGAISGDVFCGGTPIHVEGWTYLEYANLDQAVLFGETEVSYQVTFTGGLTVKDGLRNAVFTGGTQSSIEGDLVNEGHISHDDYSFTFSLTGDLINHGLIDNSFIELVGDAPHHLSASPGALFDADLFLPEFVGGDVVAETPLTFSSGLSLSGGTLTLMPGADLHFNDYAGMGGGTVFANGNTISMSGTHGALGDLVFDSVVLAGAMRISFDSQFTGGLTVQDTLQCWEFYSPTLTVDGPLLNQGTIQDNVGVLTLRLQGDAQNLGLWTNTTVIVAGALDQAIGAGPGIDVPSFVLDSQLSAASYQWYRDGIALPGETASTLTLNTVGASDYGAYRCEGAGGVLSRQIVIDEFADPTAVPVAAPAAQLAQNFPNPFNPATRIDFTLTRRSQTHLSVTDVAGREVAVLVNGALDAGAHQIEWRPADLPSGLYLIRLRTDDAVIVRKCTLLK
ncbi:MAG: T9SS type A sorting domain-containing protein [Candidatus Latescibacteria bacterium]|nr:T9SS type A sorting domain-containing protein [Candidatus Latescibacterota bacterium]